MTVSFGSEPFHPKEGTMHVQITIVVAGREVETVQREIQGTPAEREELAHAVGREVGRVVNEQALTEWAQGEAGHPHCCGRSMQSKGWLRITVQGLDGPIRIPRRRCRCRTCGRDLYAGDGLLLCGRHRVTRPLAQRACQLAAIEHFTHLPQLLFDQHGVRLAHEELIELVHDVGGQADRLRRAEAQNWLGTPPEQRVWPEAEVKPKRLYVSCDGITYCTNLSEPDPQHPGHKRLIWQQMKVGCVYWQDASERWHKQMVWGREGVEEFGASLYRLACRCGVRQADEVIFIADGGDWCWTIQQRYFPAAAGIVDWYHVSEHVWDCGKALEPNAAAAQAWVDQALTLLHDSGGWGVVQWLREALKPLRGKKRAAVQSLLNYLEPRQLQADYPRFRGQGWQIGSGMIESTARQLVGLRLKGPGMHWTEAGAVAITAIRAWSLNDRWHQFWSTLALNC
jgi:hypothetical protein